MKNKLWTLKILIFFNNFKTQKLKSEILNSMLEFNEWETKENGYINTTYINKNT